MDGSWCEIGRSGKRPGGSLYNIGTNAARMAKRRIPFAKAAAF
jgi:hypothetical protein